MEDGEHIIGPIKANNGSEREENSNSQSHTRDKTQSHLDGEEPLMAHIPLSWSDKPTEDQEEISQSAFGENEQIEDFSLSWESGSDQEQPSPGIEQVLFGGNEEYEEVSLPRSEDEDHVRNEEIAPLPSLDVPNLGGEQLLEDISLEQKDMPGSGSTTDESEFVDWNFTVIKDPAEHEIEDVSLDWKDESE